MRFYFHLFFCAYWVSVHDIKEKSSPQEYAFLYVFIIDVLLFVTIMGLVNIVVGYNVLNGLIVLISCSFIALFNYLIFIRNKKYIHQLESFKDLSSPEFQKKRIRIIVVTFLVVGLLAIGVSTLNNQEFRAWINL
jgi:ABC-type Fe3+ transport system substrate-binding protein